jgi:hypothetical protein
MRHHTRGTGAIFSGRSGSAFPHRASIVGASIIGASGGAVSAIAMQLDPDGVDCRLVLLDGIRPVLTLGPYSEDDIVAEWRAIAAASGLPLALRLSNGSIMALYPQVGRLRIGPGCPRSRHGLLGGRRPRFLTRRKTSRFPVRPRIHREPEIAAGQES